MKQGKRHGPGTFVWPNKSVFNGEYLDDNANGFGVMNHKGGSYYEGEWRDNKAHGKGKYVFENESSVYIGDFSQDLKEGKGIQTYKDGSSYEGDFSKGMKDGDGLFKFTDGATYEG